MSLYTNCDTCRLFITINVIFLLCRGGTYFYLVRQLLFEYLRRLWISRAASEEGRVQDPGKLFHGKVWEWKGAQLLEDGWSVAAY